MYPEYFFFKESKENPRSRSLYFGTKGKELKLMEENIVVQRSSVHWRSQKIEIGFQRSKVTASNRQLAFIPKNFFKTIFSVKSKESLNIFSFVGSQPRSTKKVIGKKGLSLCMQWPYYERSRLLFSTRDILFFIPFNTIPDKLRFNLLDRILRHFIRSWNLVRQLFFRYLRSYQRLGNLADTFALGLSALAFERRRTFRTCKIRKLHDCWWGKKLD